MASLRKQRTDVTADSAGDGEETSEATGGYRSPVRVLRIDIDDSAAAGSGSSEVTDERGTVLAADDPTTNLWTTDDSVSSNQHPGVLAAGPLTFTIEGWTEDDVITFRVFYDNG